ncbi:MAG: hypothetical protein FWG68_02615, partial [Defluviitaleaceae bacterium]|nr:hypothetical protein [Defluviitaleaceae bacterium]
TLYTIQDVAVIVATKITQQFGVNLDGAEFSMGFIGGFWGVNILLDPERAPTGGLPYVIPDFHARLDEVTRTVTVNNLGELPSLVPVIEVEVEVEVEPALPTQTLDIDGATITIIDHTTDGNPELYTAQDVAAMVAAEITQQFGANLDGAEFTMGFIGGFWGVNVVLDPERTPTGGLPYLIPDFHASFIETEGILNVNDFDR